MEGLYPGIAAALVLLVLVLLVRGGKGSEGDPDKRRTWDEVARRLGGRLLVKEGEFRVRFKWHGLEAVLLEEPATTFRIEKSGLSRLDLELVPPTERGAAAEPGVAKLLRGKVARELDDRTLPGYWLCSSNLGAAAEFLSPRVRRVLDDLGRKKNPRVTIGESFAVRGEPGPEARDLVRFASLCLQLAQHARVFAERDTGIRILETPGPSAGLCQICGADLGGEVVACTLCATPHHRDCWEYAGVCSTYGCGGKETRP
jgi:hypothetical protein